VRVRVRRAVINDIVGHAREESPNECCGLLVGTANEVAWAERAHNLRSSPNRFLIDPEAHFAAIKHAREAGLVVMGAYHSHPLTGPSPSAIDLAEVSYPDFVHLIVSLADATGGPEVRGFRFGTGNCQPVDLVVVG
jgi:proteasome lid subunit RPN8/RPN11